MLDPADHEESSTRSAPSFRSVRKDNPTNRKPGGFPPGFLFISILENWRKLLCHFGEEYFLVVCVCCSGGYEFWNCGNLVLGT